MGILKTGAGKEITSSLSSLGKLSGKKNKLKLLTHYQQAFSSLPSSFGTVVNGKSVKRMVPE